MLEAIKKYYEQYVNECRYEFGDSSSLESMSFKEYCEFFEITEETTLEEVYEIFAI